MTHRRRETRLALVLNGGVSLAVWMGGVAREIDALLRASETGDAAPDPDPHVEAWRQVLLFVGGGVVPRVVVDLIAGTSAGGLNGALLGSAIARGDHLDNSLRDLWLEAGDLSLNHLVPGPGDPQASLLDGDFFEDQVRVALKLPPAGETSTSETPALADSAPGTSRGDCTLLMTATALGSRAPQTGEPVDSRRVYQFINRSQAPTGPPVENWNRNDFLSRKDALALAARSSASFPVAFTPPYESMALRKQRVDFDDKSNQPRAFLADGGVLDNAPFEPLLAALMERPVTAPFDRFLVYIKPSVAGDVAPTPLPADPNLHQTLGRVIAAAREPDSREAARALLDAREYMRHTANDRDLVLWRCWEARGQSMNAASLESAATAVHEHYRRGREQTRQAHGSNLPDRPPNLGPLPDVPTSAPAMQFDLAQGDLVDWGISTAERLIRWWGRMLGNPELGGDDAQVSAAFEAVASARRFVTVLIDTLPEAYPEAATAEQLSNHLWTACAAVAPLVPGAPSAAQLMNTSLHMEVLALVFAWGTQDQNDPPRIGYLEITPACEPLVDIGAADQRPTWQQRHLYGTRWGHFGAFGDRKWRQHDWLWGRLDGATSLLGLLLDQLAVEDGQATSKLRDELGSTILAQENTSLHDVATGAIEVRDGQAGSLWKSFAQGMSTQTRQAIVAKLEAIPNQNLEPRQARQVLAAFGGSCPKGEGIKEKASLHTVRLAAYPMRRKLRGKIGAMLGAR